MMVFKDQIESDYALSSIKGIECHFGCINHTMYTLRSTDSSTGYQYQRCLALSDTDYYRNGLTGMCLSIAFTELYYK